MAPVGSVGTVPNNLPRPLTSFVGRAAELRELTELLGRCRLLTLSGPGGSGKTRLSLRLAAEVADDYPDGVYFAGLAPVRSPAGVAPALAHAIGLREVGDRPLLDRLRAHLGGKRLLLLLDNFEHVGAAAPLVTNLLAAAPEVRVVVTSRAPLHVSGEQEYEVRPLPMPDVAERTVARVLAADSVRLFAERAAAACPGFRVDEANGTVIAAITRRLDGLPLAIELGAVRVKLLPPAALLAQLDRSLNLLVVGARDLQPRQRTLRATIAWSYGLLGEAGRQLLAVCSVFRGGIGLDAVSAVCAASTDSIADVLDAVEELVDQSLLRRVEGSDTPRFAILETVREYGAERLAELPERDRVLAAHAATFLALGEKAARALCGPGEREWLDRLESEHQNIGVALDWYRQHDPADGLRLAAAVARFWGLRGHFEEGRRHLRELLRAGSGDPTVRIDALTGAAQLAVDQGEPAQARLLLGESLRIARARADRRGEAMTLAYLGRSWVSGGEPDRALEPTDRALALLRPGCDPVDLAVALLYAGLAEHFTGQLGAADAKFQECVELCDRIGFRSVGARALHMLGFNRLESGDPAGARTALCEALPTCLELGDRWVIPLILTGLAGVAAANRQPRRALTLAGAARALCEAGQFSLPATIESRLARWVAPAERRFGAAARQLLDDGRRMTAAELVSYALADPPRDEPAAGPATALTRREAEVVALVARGLTNRTIAGQLQLSVRTVDAHLDHVLGKLALHSRTQLAAWAFEHGLLPRS